MRVLFTLFILFYSSALFAQKAIAYNQTYVYKKTDGFEGENYEYVYQAKNGKIYTAPYTGNALNIIGNNYSRQITFGGLMNFASINELDSNKIFFATSTNLYVIQNDSIINTIPMLNSSQVKKISSNKFLILTVIKTGSIIYLFDGKKLDSVADIKEASNNKSFYYTYFKDTLYMYSDSLLMKVNFNNKTITKNTIPKYKKIENVSANTFFKFKNYNDLFKLNKGEFYKISNIFFNPFTQIMETLQLVKSGNTHFLQKSTSVEYTILDADNLQPQAFFNSNDIVTNPNKVSNSSYLVGAGNMPFRLFDYIKKYPKIYNNIDASNIFSVVQHTNGAIWAGSYKGTLSIIDGNTQKQLPINNIQFMNGGVSYNNKMYLIGETGKIGLVKVNKNGSYIKLTKDVTGFCTYLSKNKKDIYFGTSNFRGLYRKKISILEDVNKPWQILDSANGVKLMNVLSIVEDTTGNIWCSHPSGGIAIFNPSTNVAKTYLKKEKETEFGFISSAIDARGTVWFGSTKGKNLWYYNNYSKPAVPSSCVQLKHPFFASIKYISAMSIYKNWLVMAAQDKILLLDLDAFHYENKIVVKYLTNQETNFTASTEQNVMLTSFTDSTIWFSTTDMLYQWDIKKWLDLPKYIVSNNVFLKTDSTQIKLDVLKTTYAAPTFTSFDINIEYLSPDGLPRYTSAALVKDGDTLNLPEPNLQSVFSIKNLSSGHYTFYVDIFEQDGSTSHYEYKIIIKKFLWQQWWFWLGIALLCIGTITYLLNLKKKKQIAEQTVKTKDAELLQVKAEQDKKIANLQLVTLSSQFRPHFILNALNTIGAQMDDKPQAESVLSRLGESINLIFSHAQQQKIVHSFKNEWQLLENIIHIHKQMYLKQLETILPTNEILSKINNINVPLGILQIPIENALLHGLSNKEIGLWLLNIAINETEDYVLVIITDNGVGRKKSATLSNFIKHGTGTKNLNEIIEIINISNSNKINVHYEDDIFNDNGILFGTKVVITLPKNLYYAAK